MKLLIRCILSVTLLAFVFEDANSQTVSKDSLLAMIRRMSGVFSNNMSVDIHYKYYTESDPHTALDSMSGFVSVTGGNYWLKLDNTETICTDNYVIHLFDDDKLMYVSKLRSQNQKQLYPDTAFLTRDIRDVRQETEKGYKIVKITFGANEGCKWMELVSDEKGHLVRTRMMVLTAYMMDAGSSDLTQNPKHDKYSIVETLYSNYRNSELKKEAFDERNFFVKNGKEVVVTEQYKTYQLFIGSPNF